jgi:hypothetical protein
MKKTLIVVLAMMASIVSAGEFIYKDEIRGGTKQVVLTSEEEYGNAMIVLFIKEKTVEFQFQSMERVSGIHIGNPKALRWTPIVSNKFSIRFDSNLAKILSDENLLKESVNVWPPCLRDDCTNDPVSKIIEDKKGKIYTSVQPNNKIKYSLGLTSTRGEFEGFYMLYKGSKRIAIEIDGKQYTFNIVN